LDTVQTNDEASFGAEMIAVTMGIDALERRRSKQDGLLDSEGLVPIYLGKHLFAARDYAHWWDVEDDLNRLQESVAGLGSERRRVFATDMIRSLKIAVRLFAGASPSFELKVRDLVGAPVGPVDPALIDAISARIDTLLRGRGFHRGTLAERITAWESSGFIDVQAIEPTVRALMAEARRRTAETIFDCGDFEMSLNPVKNVPYTARCSFSEGKMDLNLENGFTRAALKHLVAHEVFPGHATQLLYTLDGVERGTSEPEALLCTANTVLGCVQEGIGDDGVELIDWLEDDDDLIYAELRNLRSAAQTSAAWHLMVDGWEADAVAAYLRETAAGQEAWVQGRLRMAAHPFRGPFIASYWAGTVAVRALRDRTPEAARAAFIAYLFGHAHSPRSLALFQPGAA
jgi:hypothetical protein